MTTTNAPHNVPPVPEVGLGDVLLLLKAVEEAVLTGRTDVPPIKLTIAHRHVTIKSTIEVAP